MENMGCWKFQMFIRSRQVETMSDGQESKKLTPLHLYEPWSSLTSRIWNAQERLAFEEL